MKRVVASSFTAVILLILIGETVAQLKPAEIATRRKQILFLYSYGPNFQPWATWSRGDPQGIEPPVALAAGHSRTFPRHCPSADDADPEFCRIPHSALRAATAGPDRRDGSPAARFRPTTQGGAVSDDADAPCGSRDPPGSPIAAVRSKTRWSARRSITLSFSKTSCGCCQGPKPSR